MGTVEYTEEIKDAAWKKKYKKNRKTQEYHLSAVYTLYKEEILIQYTTINMAFPSGDI